MKRIFLTLIFIGFQITAAFSAVYYVATNGSDTNSGSLTEPFATIQRGQTAVSPGDTVYVRGGTYLMTEAQIAKYNGIWAYVTYLDKSGTAGNLIKYWAYPGEKPIFDFSNIKPADCRVFAFMVTGSYIYLKGLEVIGVQVTILAHTQSECFHNEGSNNIYEQLTMHDGMAIGFYLTKGSNNLVLNCDAYRNWDNVSENMKGGNTDGFGCHPSKGSVGNILRGCRAWFNSDDGYDCISASESVIFENCWAFENGYSPSFASLGDGNGFKAGGHGAAPGSIDGMPNPVPAHTVRFCMAYRNKSSGFYANHQIITGNFWYNNTAYRNGTNYNMLSQNIVKDGTGNDITVDVPGINHVLHNNISFRYGSQTELSNMGTSVNTYNSFSPNSGVTVSSDDFLSIDEALLVSPRKSDGSLPEVDFLRLKQSSDLIDKGMDLGFGYSGSVPDLGAFEFKLGQTITFDTISPRVLGSAAFNANATATSGLPVTLTSTNTSVAVIVAGKYISIRGIGSTLIIASQAGNNYYYAAQTIVRTLNVLPTALNNHSTDRVALYPVPVSDVLNIEVPLTSNEITLQLFSYDGKVLISQSINNSNVQLDMSKFNAGMYIVKIHSSQLSVIRKILKK